MEPLKVLILFNPVSFCTKRTNSTQFIYDKWKHPQIEGESCHLNSICYKFSVVELTEQKCFTIQMLSYCTVFEQNINIRRASPKPLYNLAQFFPD